MRFTGMNQNNSSAEMTSSNKKNQQLRRMQRCIDCAVNAREALHKLQSGTRYQYNGIQLRGRSRCNVSILNSSPTKALPALEQASEEAEKYLTVRIESLYHQKEKKSKLNKKMMSDERFAPADSEKGSGTSKEAAVTYRKSPTARARKGSEYLAAEVEAAMNAVYGPMNDEKDIKRQQCAQCGCDKSMSVCKVPLLLPSMSPMFVKQTVREKDKRESMNNSDPLKENEEHDVYVCGACRFRDDCVIEGLTDDSAHRDSLLRNLDRRRRYIQCLRNTSASAQKENRHMDHSLQNLRLLRRKSLNSSLRNSREVYNARVADYETHGLTSEDVNEKIMQRDEFRKSLSSLIIDAL